MRRARSRTEPSKAKPSQAKPRQHRKSETSISQSRQPEQTKARPDAPMDAPIYLRAAAARSRHRQPDRLRDGGGLLRVADERPSAGGRPSAAIAAAACAAAAAAAVTVAAAAAAARRRRHRHRRRCRRRRRRHRHRRRRRRRRRRYNTRTKACKAETPQHHASVARRGWLGTRYPRLCKATPSFRRHQQLQLPQDRDGSTLCFFLGDDQACRSQVKDLKLVA